MNVGLYRGAAAMVANERRLEAIAANLANVGTAGYKRIAAVHNGGLSRRAPGHTTVRTSLSVDWSQGRLQRTGIPTDMALMGQGFFAVEGPEGEKYTRDGHFFLTEDGVLSTQEGFPVAWDGARGHVDPLGERIDVDSSGRITQGTRLVGRLKLVDFPAVELLQQEGGGYFGAQPTLARGPADVEVHQGAVEAANVAAVDEMVALIQTQRAFDAGSRVMSLISQSYRRLNNSR